MADEVEGEGEPTIHKKAADLLSCWLVLRHVDSP